MIDPTDPFTAADTGRVAAAHDVPETALSDALAAVQTAAAAPTVAAVVYDYRQAFRTDPLVARHGDAHFLAVPPRVWPEFAATLSLSDATLAACRGVHAAAFDALEADALGSGDAGDDREPLVLVG